MNLEQKTAGAIETLQQTTRGGGCGCVGVGCGLVAVLCLTLCVGSYFLTMHSSLPLSMIESALESEGNVQVEGLKGSISSGFEIESLKFESDECDEWNELRQVRFSYNGFFDLMRTKRLIINDASIGSATIYARIDGEGQIDVASDIDGEEVAKEFTDEWQEMQEGLEGSDSNDLKELRIDSLSARNIAIVDPDSGTRLEFAKLEFKDYQMLDGQIKRLGDLEVVSDQIDLHTERSTRYSNEPIAWNLIGNVKPVVHKNLIRDIPFNIDFAIQGSKRFSMHLVLCDGQVEIDEPYGEKRKVRLRKFSHGQYFDTGTPLVPSEWDVALTIIESKIQVELPEMDQGDGDELDQPDENPPESKDQGEGDKDEGLNRQTGQNPNTRNADRTIHTLQIQPGGSFLLGKSRFLIETEQVVFGPEDSGEPAIVTATSRIDSDTIKALITLQGDAPWFVIQLESDNETPAKDIWSKLFFEKTYVELESDQQVQVDAAMKAADPWRALDHVEAVDF